MTTTLRTCSDCGDRPARARGRQCWACYQRRHRQDKQQQAAQDAAELAKNLDAFLAIFDISRLEWANFVIAKRNSEFSTPCVTRSELPVVYKRTVANGGTANEVTTEGTGTAHQSIGTGGTNCQTQTKSV